MSETTTPGVLETQEIARAMAAHFGLKGAAQDAAVENIMRFARCVAREQRYAAVDQVNGLGWVEFPMPGQACVELDKATSRVQNAAFPKTIRANVEYFTS